MANPNYTKPSSEFIKDLAIYKDTHRAKSCRGEEGAFQTYGNIEFKRDPKDYEPETIVHPVSGERVVCYKAIPFSGTWRYDETLKRWVQVNAGKIPSNRIYDS